MEQVHNTAPFLSARFPAPESGRLCSLAGTAEGFLRILSSWRNMQAPDLTPDQQLADYFAFCLACHHATVATFVPTDVDTKIRGIVWRATRDRDALADMLGVALAARGWSDDGISTRSVRGVSGHNGEHWSALAAGLGRLLELGHTDLADQAQEAIEREIGRQQRVFDEVAAEREGELDLLRVAMTLAHNRGDLTQGMGFWKKNTVTGPVMDHLQHKGRFAGAVYLYQQTGISAEGHRHYPLRAVKALRRSPEWLLPLSPFLDDWGFTVARLPEAHEVMGALVEGCQKIPGQQGYYRALAGMRAADSGAFDRACGRLSNSQQKQLRGGELRRLIEVPRVSFESAMRKRARQALKSLGTGAGRD